MKRIFNDYAYGNGPRDSCWWDETCDMPDAEILQGSLTVDVAIIGGGFTGLSAALELASQGAQVALLESHFLGWGASGRNGGFCCLGGGLAEDDELDKSYGRARRLEFRKLEKAAVDHVEMLIERLDLDVDRHSRGETELAHRPKDMVDLRTKAERVFENYGVEPEIIEERDLGRHGMIGGPFFGGMTVPIGFGLNPRKYLAGLVSAAAASGARLFVSSQVRSISQIGSKHVLDCSTGSVSADQIIVASNGYSSEDIPAWLAGRYMPGQSTVLVTRKLSESELSNQGWTSDQMSYDTRNLLHYFRLMPDRRFLFGMRGALHASPRAEAKARAKTRLHFERMFPAWSHVENSNSWSGFVNLARKKLPFVGALPSNNGIWAAMCYHGNGIAMGSYAGQMVADLVLNGNTPQYPEIIQRPLGKFPLGPARRLLMPPLYAGLTIRDLL